MPAIAAEIAASLRRLVGSENVLAARSEMLVYECDGFTIEKNSPDAMEKSASDTAT